MFKKEKIQIINFIGGIYNVAHTSFKMSVATEKISKVH